MRTQLLDMLQLAIILLVSIGLHEFAHAYVSYKLGDPTPKIQGRLTPNPLKHIDPIGFFMIFFIHFGRGKPVQINPNYYKRPYRDELLVALAGPFTNILLGIAGIIIIFVYLKIFNIPLQNIMLGVPDLVSNFWMLFVMINFSLAAFNMIPLPPLDGYRIIKLISPKAGEFLEKYTRYIAIAFLILVVFWPWRSYLSEYINIVTSALFSFFWTILSPLFFW